MRNPVLFLVAVVAVASLLVGCGGSGGGASARALAHRDYQIEEQQDQIGNLQDRNAYLEQELQAWRDRPPVTAQPAPVEGLPANTEYEWRNGELVITINNSILFRSGSADLTSSARGTLRDVVRVIRRDYPSNYVRVEGHTDNQPIRRTRDTWSDNWHLSGGRARSVLNAMVELGIPSSQIAFAGYGPERPRASNSSDNGRQQNRRVEIVVLPQRRPGN